jgi:tRNA A-37 threonylcarbamoyl transferase component Bud32/tetratricopeptide (TPR) repeat protein
MVGRNVSHYRILGELGAGASGVVYRAVDTQTGRQVAVKLLRPEVLDDPEALARFRREARITATLRHPNICGVYEVGEHRGQQFIVLELLEGTRLDRVIAAGPAPPEDVWRLGLDVCAALEAAHAHGVVHRDIKPSNIFVTRDGRAKVMDFGLAKHVRRGVTPDDLTRTMGSADDLTRPGMTVGTMAYMAPEQARGQAVDARVDLFSLGAVLYELATGVRAFPGATMAAVFDALLNRDPRPAHHLNPGVPTALSAVLARALRKDRRARPQRAAELRAELRAAAAAPAASFGPAGTGGGSGAAIRGTNHTGPTRRAGRRGQWAAAAAILLAACLVTAGMLSRRESAAPAAAPAPGHVLLGTFANTTGDAVFDDTLRHAVAVHLGGSAAISIMADERVREGLRLTGRPANTPLTRELAREVCVRQGADAVVDGGIAAVSGAYAIRVEAVACADARPITRQQMTAARKEDVLREVGRAAVAVRAALGSTLARREAAGAPRVEAATTPSLAALKAYTDGVAARARGGELDAIPLFERAVALDPHFASAYYALSSIYGSAGDAARGEQYARRAYAEREHVSERERLSITYQYHDRVTGDLDKAIATLQVWAQSYVRDHTPANNLALVYNRIGQFERAVDAAHEAQRRNPAHAFPYSNLAYAYRGLNRYAEARETAMRAVARGIETVPTRRLLYQLAVLEGDEAAAAAHLAAVRGRDREFDLVGARAQVAAFEGRRAEARRLYAVTETMARSGRLAELADGYALQAGWMEVGLGDPVSARTRVTPLLAARDPTVRLGAVTVIALSGHPEGLDAVVSEVATARPDDTLLQSVWVPVARAALDLARGNPRGAVTRLEPTIPYETGRMAAMLPVWLRGLALIAAGDGAAAAAQFRHVLAHRGSDPFSIFCAVAPVHLARALDLAGNVTGAAAARDALARQWSRADPGLPAAPR